MPCRWTDQKSTRMNSCLLIKSRVFFRSWGRCFSVKTLVSSPWGNWSRFSCIMMPDATLVNALPMDRSEEHTYELLSLNKKPGVLPILGKMFFREDFGVEPLGKLVALLMHHDAGRDTRECLADGRHVRMRFAVPLAEVLF